jgi:queuine tRNA-ribosyltransferase
MGVGSPEDLVEGVARGVDMFDCALPTRIARNGSLLTRRGRLNVVAAPSRYTEGPIDPECDCHTCRTFSAAYVHHLFRARELLAYRLATIHNLRFVARLMAELRLAIQEGRFAAFRDAFHRRYVPADETARREQNKRVLGAGC